MLSFAFIQFFLFQANGQSDLSFTSVTEFKWELDYKVFLKLANDSNFSYDIRQVFHIPKDPINLNQDYVYYPVNLDNEYIEQLKQRSVSVADSNLKYKTLWSALHASLGGGWVHFTNCLLYAFETGQLSLTAPLMQRPETTWKPKPLTESYKRTRKWKYYVPAEYKNALKEYKIRKTNNALGDLKSLPDEYINLFLNTNDKQYKKYLEANEKNILAKVDLVKLLLGTNFIGEAQISYIRSTVLSSTKNYSLGKLPSVVIFDEFDAAAVMTLNQNGYNLDAVAFKKSSEMTPEEISTKKQQISEIIKKINEYNQNSFIKRLENYYKK